MARATQRIAIVGALVLLVFTLSAVRAEAQTKSDPASDPTTTIQQALEDASVALERGRGDEALDGLRAIETTEPNNPWAMYFRGRAHRLMGNAYRAMEAYDDALDELASLGDPDPELVKRIRNDRRTARREVFNLSFQTGLAYDSNVTFSGDGSISQVIAGRGDGKFSSVLNIDYIPYATGNEALALGLRLEEAWNFSIKAFNFQNYGGYVRYARRLNASWSFELRYDTDLAYLGNQPFSSIHGLTPRFTYRWSPRTAAVTPSETSFYYRLDARDFLFDTPPKLDRDGFANSVGVEQTLNIHPSAERPDWTWNLLTGYRFQSVATEGSEFDRLANDFYFGLTVPMNNSWLDGKPLTARFSAHWAFDDYRRRSTIDRRRRRRDDLITTLGVVLSQVLIEDPVRGDLILHGIFNWTNADSNVIARSLSAPFSYDKIVAGFQLEWRF